MTLLPPGKPPEARLRGGGRCAAASARFTSRTSDVDGSGARTSARRDLGDHPDDAAWYLWLTPPGSWAARSSGLGDSHSQGTRRPDVSRCRRLFDTNGDTNASTARPTPADAARQKALRSRGFPTQGDSPEPPEPPDPTRQSWGPHPARLHESLPLPDEVRGRDEHGFEAVGQHWEPCAARSMRCRVVELAPAVRMPRHCQRHEGPRPSSHRVTALGGSTPAPPQGRRARTCSRLATASPRLLRHGHGPLR